MLVEQLYTNCLSEAAYFIADADEAAVIDPLRDVDVYIEMAKEKKVRIKYIFETHFHADFVSGHLELARKTGATIVYGPQTNAAFDFYCAKDGETFPVGNVVIKAIHTPGHTLESTCYLLSDEQGKDYYIFTGDTLFVGDVGRPDLFSGTMDKEDLAALMYDSLNNKIKPLADDVIIYPAHGPGSACGKNLGKETFSTIGTQKATNYALQDQDRESFIKAVTSGLNQPPAYFPINAKMNATGYADMEELKQQALVPLSVAQFETSLKGDVLVLDTRNATVFTEGFVPGSISIGLEGRFAEWAGSLLPFDKKIILVTEPGKEEETMIRLARVGIEKIYGYLEGGFEAWKDAGKKVDLIINIEPEELALDLPFDKKIQVVDVRKAGEFHDGHIQGAINLPLNDLMDPAYMAHVDDGGNVYVHCAGGYRSVIACSLMKKEGFHNIRNILGGYAKIKETEDIPIVQPAPSGEN